MNQLDRLYRGLIDYRKQTVGDYDCDTWRESIANADAQDDTIELERKICTVENDWIDEIEKGLTFIEKAIREERQFIRSNGEILPIEKVKRVDKESVAHLARHSDLLTRKPEEGEDIIPDQLYTVERLSDFAVYENRFLYMLLCYLRDFITLRYNKILELTTTYNGSLSMNKVIVHRKQKLQFEVKLVEQRKNDAYLREYNEAKEAISRMDLLLKAVIHYLSTPLMEEVCKSPMLKPPITKTNVLKMNQNFKACMALYEYVTAYSKQGYTVEEVHKKINPFPEKIGDELAEATSLLSFLTYEHSLGIEDYLREEYNKEEERRKEAEAQKLVEQIRNLKRRIRESGMSPEEYMLLLEKRNRSLESDSAQLIIAKQEIEHLKGEVENLQQNVATLEAEVLSLNEQIVALKEQHAREIAALKEEHARQMEELRADYEKKIADLTEKYEKRIADLTERYENTIAELKSAHEKAIAELTEKYEGEIERITTEHAQAMQELKDAHAEQVKTLEERNATDRAEFEKTMAAWQEEYTIKEEKMRAEWALETSQWKEKVREKNIEVENAHKETEDMLEQRRLAEGRMNALRLEYGLIKDETEFTSQVSFDELEHQYRTLEKLFKREWGKVKKDLRSRIVWKLFKKGKNAEEEQTTDGAESVQDGVQDGAQESGVIPEESQTAETVTADNDVAELAAANGSEEQEAFANIDVEDIDVSALVDEE